MHPASAPTTIVCLPYAGGGASAFHAWREGLGPSAKVIVPPLPGRDSLMRRPALTRMDPMVRHLREQLHDRGDAPWILFGHSMGALIAFELTRSLHRSGGPKPAHLVVSGHPAPDRRRSRPPLHAMPEVEFIRELRGMEGTPEAFFASAELRELLLPRLRADFELCETYRFEPADPLPVPITALSGEQDAEVGVDEVLHWATHTTGAFEHLRLGGGHFFIDSCRAQVLGIVRRIIEAARSSPVSPPR